MQYLQGFLYNFLYVVKKKSLVTILFFKRLYSSNFYDICQNRENSQIIL